MSGFPKICPSSPTGLQGKDQSAHQLPSEIGGVNMLRTGESQFNIPLHAGPVVLTTIDPQRPAYRVMMQTKVGESDGQTYTFDGPADTPHGRVRRSDIHF